MKQKQPGISMLRPDCYKVFAFIGWAVFTFISHYFAKERLLYPVSDREFFFFSINCEIFSLGLAWLCNKSLKNWIVYVMSRKH